MFKGLENLVILMVFVILFIGSLWRYFSVFLVFFLLYFVLLNSIVFVCFFVFCFGNEKNEVILFWEIVFWNNFLLDGISVWIFVFILFVDCLNIVIDLGFFLKVVIFFWI